MTNIEKLIAGIGTRSAEDARIIKAVREDDSMRWYIRLQAGIVISWLIGVLVIAIINFDKIRSILGL